MDPQNNKGTCPEESAARMLFEAKSDQKLHVLHFEHFTRRGHSLEKDHMPIHRNIHEHKLVWKILKTVPELTSQLSDDYLKSLSKCAISETWIKGSTVVGNDGFYVILKGIARPQTRVEKCLIKEKERSTFRPQHIQSSLYKDCTKSSSLPDIYLCSQASLLKQWSTFGTLKILPENASETQANTVMIEEDCEILKIPAKEFAKIKEENSMIVESGNIISYVVYINSGYCSIYRSITGLVKLPLNRVKKVRKLVEMGTVKEKESFGEISILLQVPFSCTVITETELEAGIIEDKDLLGK
ncbi:PREDICTED: cyclic nucleotide-binding domain-containing protein 1 [Elephantulus edwardii]|uniref:cyclic nucleotide-binding domain-containing protein 1 n=1 Tax=Elephantulus edwardii TaxID=28737 RepID=UPI0003F05C86|nr:PREDICTED: cyclic nucleotide-binding domain-containing protein 1 [Elephantulus edwardii]